MAVNRTERSSRGTYRGGSDVNATSGNFNKETTGLPYDGGAPYPSRKRYANTKPRLLKQAEKAKQELREQQGSGIPSTSEAAQPSKEGGGQGEHVGGGSDEANGADAPSRGEQPTATPRKKPEQRPHCKLVHVDLTDCDTMYLLSQRDRLSRLDPKRKSMAMKRIQEVMHEIEFEKAVSPAVPAKM